MSYPSYGVPLGTQGSPDNAPGTEAQSQNVLFPRSTAYSAVFEVIDKPVLLRAFDFGLNTVACLQMVYGQGAALRVENFGLQGATLCLTQKANVLPISVEGRYRLVLTGADPLAVTVTLTPAGLGFGGADTPTPASTFTLSAPGSVVRSLDSKLSESISVLDFPGADPTGVTDSTPAIQAAVTAAAGREVFMPLGTYRMASAVTYAGVINVRGEGHGAGPGAAEQDGPCTRLLLDFANPSAFIATTNRPCFFRNFMIDVNPAWRPAGSGAGIFVSGAGANNANTVIEGVAFNNLNTGIRGFKASWWTIRGNYFGKWIADAIYMDTDATWEGSAGFITGNFIFGDPTVTQRAGIFLRHGYAIIQSNEILGAQVGVRVENSNYPAGFIRVLDNTIEEQFYYGVSVTTTDGSAVTMVEISRNEFSAVATAPTYLGSIITFDGPASFWLDDLAIRDNTSRHNGGCANGVFRIGAGRTVQISGNVTENLSATAIPINIIFNGIAVNTALGGNIQVLDNITRGAFTQLYNFANISPGVTLRDQLPMTVAQLPGNCREGSVLFASDGRRSTAANYAVVAGGTGCFVTRQRGAWTALELSALASHSVTDFGAVGNGTTDDTAAIQAAINAVAAGGGGDLMLLSETGTYAIAGTLDFTQKHAVRMVGKRERFSVLKRIGASTAPVVRSSPGVGVSTLGIKFTNIAVDGSGVAQTGVEWRGVDGGGCDGLTVYGCTAQQVLLDTNVSGTAPTQGAVFESLLVFATGAAHGVEIGAGSMTENTNLNNFFNLRCYHQNGDGLRIQNGDSNRFFGILTGVSGGGTGKGIRLRGAAAEIMRARANWFHACQTDFGAGIVCETAAFPATDNTFWLQLESGAEPPLMEAGARNYWYSDKGYSKQRGMSVLNSQKAAVVFDQTGFTAGAQVGTDRPLYAMAANPALGFNLVYDAGNWRYGQGSLGHHAGLLSFDAATGDLVFFSTAVAGNEGAIAAITEKARFGINGTTLLLPTVAGPSKTLWRDTAAANAVKQVP